MMSSAQNLKNFLIPDYKTFWVFGGFEQLSSLIGWRVIVFSQNGQGYLLCDLHFYLIVGFYFEQKFWLLMC